MGDTICHSANDRRDSSYVLFRGLFARGATVVGCKEDRGEHIAATVGDVLVDRLISWGVDTIFGLPGDGINGVFEALRQKQDKVRFIQVRHEEAAAFAACGYAKFTGRLGVCIATSGPGGVHLLNGLYDAKFDRQPVLAITGHTFHNLIGTHYRGDKKRGEIINTLVENKVREVI